MHLQVQQLLFPGTPSAKGSGKMPMERTFKVFTCSSLNPSGPALSHPTVQKPSSLWVYLMSDKLGTVSICVACGP